LWAALLGTVKLKATASNALLRPFHRWSRTRQVDRFPNLPQHVDLLLLSINVRLGLPLVELEVESDVLPVVERVAGPGD
jgi:hypothetical protein